MIRTRAEYKRALSIWVHFGRPGGSSAEPIIDYEFRVGLRYPLWHIMIKHPKQDEPFGFGSDERRRARRMAKQFRDFGCKVKLTRRIRKPKGSP
jgi:hypothetical protein